MGWTITRESGNRILVTFSGRLSSTDGEQSIREFNELLGEETLEVIWDVHAMNGYDSGARRAWQHGLGPRRGQIRAITLVGGSALVQMGASAISLFLGIKCRFVASLDQLESAPPST